MCRIPNPKGAERLTGHIEMGLQDSSFRASVFYAEGCGVKTALQTKAQAPVDNDLKESNPLAFGQ